MNCIDCGTVIADDLRFPRCLGCFRSRVDALCAAIDEAARVGPGTVTAVYLQGMLALGADPQEVRTDIALADLADLANGGQDDGTGPDR